MPTVCPAHNIRLDLIALMILDIDYAYKWWSSYEMLDTNNNIKVIIDVNFQATNSLKFVAIYLPLSHSLQITRRQCSSLGPGSHAGL